MVFPCGLLRVNRFMLFCKVSYGTRLCCVGLPDRNDDNGDNDDNDDNQNNADDAGEQGETDE